MQNPEHPWRLDTNARFREVIRMIFGLSTATILLPVFFAREFLSIPQTVALKDVYSSAIYWSWGLLSLSIIFGILFHYFSAKWIRLAWNKTAKLLFIEVNDSTVEILLDLTFWGCILTFVSGIAALINFIVCYYPPV